MRKASPVLCSPGRSSAIALLQIDVSLRKSGVGEKWTESTRVGSIRAGLVAEQKGGKALGEVHLRLCSHTAMADFNPNPYRGEASIPHVSEDFFKVYFIGAQVI